MGGGWRLVVIARSGIIWFVIKYYICIVIVLCTFFGFSLDFHFNACEGVRCTNGVIRRLPKDNGMCIV